jgi:hypothetical protein
VFGVSEHPKHLPDYLPLPIDLAIAAYAEVTTARNMPTMPDPTTASCSSPAATMLLLLALLAAAGIRVDLQRGGRAHPT